MRLNLIIGLLVIALVQVSAEATAQKVTIQAQDVAMESIFQSIIRQTGYVFVYDSQSLKDVKVSLSIKELSLEEALTACLANLPFSFKIVEKNILIRSEKQTETSGTTPGLQQREITGTVTGENGEPLEGVTVTLKGTTTQAFSNKAGNYRISVPQGGASLVFTIVGYEAKEISIGAANWMNVALKVLISDLDEIVVVGFGQQKKATITGALSTLGTKELLQSPQANISNMLVGRLPGLLAVQRSGLPGEDQSTLRIRGVGTFSGSQAPLIMVDGIEGVNFNNIDPNEIESVSILKDASATAVYGVRGANGVILITTKRGVLGRPKISFTTNFATTSFTDMRESARAYPYVKGFNEALKYDSYISGGYTPKFSAEDIEKFRTGEDPLFYPDVDWFNTMYRERSGQMQHNLSINGGTERVKYFVSAGYFNQEGLFNENITKFTEAYHAQPTFSRYNFRSNLDFEILKGLSATLNISYQFEEQQGAFHDLNARLEVITRSNPINSPGIVDGKPITLGVAGPAGGVLGSLFSSGYQRRHRNYLNGFARLNYDLAFITEGLSTHGTVSYVNYNTQDGGFYKPVVMYLPVRNPDHSIVYVPQREEGVTTYSESIDKNRREYVEFGMTYSRRFGAHNVGGLLLYNQNKYHSPALAFLIPRGHQGLVGRATYDYLGRYMAEVNVGYNGTENFAEGKRFGFFPAYSLGWTVSEEPFFPTNTIVPFLKVRGSMGEVGNDQIGGDRFLYLPSSYNFVNNYYSFGEIGSSYQQYRASTEGKIGNPDLTWERARKTNIGIEGRFFNNAIQVTADWFEEKRDNILANLGTVPFVVGANLPASNFGRMRNSGFDGDISFQHQVQDFNYWVKANFTYARNVIEFQDEVTRPYDYQYRTGQRHGQNFGLLFDGFYNTWEEVNDPVRPRYGWSNDRIQPGDARYKDVNGDGNVDVDDMVPIGYSNFPDKIGGLSFGGDFKGFDFSILFQWAGNVSVSYSRNFRYGYREEAGITSFILDQSWTHERYINGEEINFPRLSEGDVNNKHNYQPSSLWVRDASYVRLKNAEIGYTSQARMLARIGISSMRLYVNGNNLLTWSSMFKGVDPESHIASTNNEPYPLIRTINFGLNVNL
ncbi:TonB-dependent receptor [Parapedobacter sp. GCM10030251]